MAHQKILTKEEILAGMRYTKSIRSLKKYLGVSYDHLKRYMKMYIDDDTGKTLFDIQRNQRGRGIPKNLKNKRNNPDVKAIFETGRGWESFTTDKIKQRGIQEGYLKEHCYICDFCERRSFDYKIPLLLRFKDGNKLNYLLNNLELVCYNCYFLYASSGLNEDEIIKKEQIKQIEENRTSIYKPFNWDLNSDDLENMKSLGVGHKNNQKDDDEYEFVTRKM